MASTSVLDEVACNLLQFWLLESAERRNAVAKKRFTKSEWAKIFERLNGHGSALGLPAARTDSFVVASWNLRQFGGLSAKKSDRARDIEAFRFIASVILRFDLVALQEVKDDLASLRQLHKLLPDYDLVVSDTTGNHERLAFLYRTGKVRHTDLAAEVDLPMDVIQRQMKAEWEAYRDAFANYGAAIAKNPRFKGRIALPTTIGFERAPHCVSFDVGSPDQPLSFLAFNTHIFLREEARRPHRGVPCVSRLALRSLEQGQSHLRA